MGTKKSQKASPRGVWAEAEPAGAAGEAGRIWPVAESGRAGSDGRRACGHKGSRPQDTCPGSEPLPALPDIRGPGFTPSGLGDDARLPC